MFDKQLLQLVHFCLSPLIIYGLIEGTEKLVTYLYNKIKRHKQLKRKGIYKKRNKTKIWNIH
jgi:hypothetical protein